MVGTGGFEPSASCSQSKRSTRLSYVPFIFANSVIIIQRLCSPTSFVRLSPFAPANSFANQTSPFVEKPATGSFFFLKPEASATPQPAFWSG